MTVKSSPGDVVAWWDGNDLSFATSGGDEKRRIRLVLPGGKEIRVQPSRIAYVVEHTGNVPGKDHDSITAAAGYAAAVESSIREAAGEVDVSLVWELAVEAVEPVPVDTLAELVLGSRDGRHCAALVTAFLGDRMHFVRRGDTWEPRPREAVEMLKTERVSTERRAVEKTEALRILEGSGAVPEGGGDNPALARYLDALKEIAVLDLDASEEARETAAEALQAAGVRYERLNEGAFRLLRRLSWFSSDDENLQIVRYNLKREFPASVMESARQAAAAGFSRDGREDLTALEMVTIDGPMTTELDDGLTVERTEEGTLSLGVHIADPNAFLVPGGGVDVEALERSLTHYMPEVKLNMLPPSIGEGAASLSPQCERPALSFIVEFDDKGNVLSGRTVRSVVRSAARLTYREADDLIAGGGSRFGPLLRDLDRLAMMREESRAAAGAVLIDAPEVDVRVDEGGRIVLDRLDAGSPARRLVTEAMILAGERAAAFCIEHQVPAIYRRQAPPEQRLETADVKICDPVEIRRIRRTLRRGETGLQPGPHHALGLQAYAQATSPLRRYQDLATHRQIHSVLMEMPPAYDTEALQRVAATTDRADRDARLAERASHRYWLLRYLQGKTGERVEAMTLEVEPRPVVLLAETLLEVPVRSLGSATPGETVSLRVVRVDPRADILSLMPD